MVYTYGPLAVCEKRS